MTVAAILRAKGTHVESTTPETTLYSVAWVLKSRGIGALVVTSEDRARILGIVSSPVLTCAPEDRVTAVMARMTRHRVRHLPVLDSARRLCGLVSIGDLVKHRLDELELEANILRDTLMVSH